MAHIDEIFYDGGQDMLSCLCDNMTDDASAAMVVRVFFFSGLLKFYHLHMIFIYAASGLIYVGFDIIDKKNVCWKMTAVRR